MNLPLRNLHTLGLLRHPPGGQHSSLNCSPIRLWKLRPRTRRQIQRNQANRSHKFQSFTALLVLSQETILEAVTQSQLHASRVDELFAVDAEGLRPCKGIILDAVRIEAHRVRSIEYIPLEL